jgi:PRTRC genetic system protein D
MPEKPSVSEKTPAKMPRFAGESGSSSQPFVVGVDTGYGNTKVFTLKGGQPKTVIFPSVTGRAAFSDDFMRTEAEVEFIVQQTRYNPDPLNFGETAVRLNRGGQATNDRARFTREYNPLLTIAGLARLIVKEQLPHKVDTLVVGLPVNYFKTYQAEITETLRGEHPITLFRENGMILRELKLVVEEVMVIPQGYGAYLSWALNENGSKNADRLVPTAVIDGGESTCDIVAAEGRYLDSLSKSIPSALDEVYHEMERQVDEQTGTFVSRTQIEAYIRQNKTMPAGDRRLDMNEMRRKIIAQKAEEIVNRILTTVRPIQPEHVLVCGGSGLELFEAIKKVLPMAEKLEPMVFANAMGYFRYGLMRLQAQATVAVEEKRAA